MRTIIETNGPCHLLKSDRQEGSGLLGRFYWVMEGGKWGSHQILEPELNDRVRAHWEGYQTENGLDPKAAMRAARHEAVRDIFLGRPREGWAYFELGTGTRVSPFFQYKSQAIQWRKLYRPLRCNRCHRPMKGTTAYDGACECGGLIEVNYD
jgi:hypothetical protein